MESGYNSYYYDYRINDNNVRIHVVGANDDRSEGKIRGSSFGCALVDEVTLLPENFFSMLLSRLSKKGAKLLSTTNPANPNHWLKTDYVGRADELGAKVFNFYQIARNTPFIIFDLIGVVQSE